MNSKGIHHITAIAGNPQTNLDFYSGILGLRLVKKTINFDDPGTYHFYFGNETGSPGTIMTFFPWGSNATKGRGGTGQVTAVSFSVPKGTLSYWIERLTEYKVIFNGPFERFGKKVISFEDPDSIEIELTESESVNTENTGIIGFNGALLRVESLAKAQTVLTDVFGFKITGNEDSRYRFESDGQYGKNIEVLVDPDSLPGEMGIGAIHHIAFRAEDNYAQAEMRKAVMESGLRTTDVINRKYFRSVYFREYNGILFEIATDDPGFLIDEDKEELGSKLQLPDWYEPDRHTIEKSLQQLKEPSPDRIYLID